MASTNKTTNYNLSQYIGSDKPTYLGDYNSDMLKIDNAMHQNALDIATADEKATLAGTNANTALTNAETAQTTADTANTTANSALSKATANESDIAQIKSKTEIMGGLTGDTTITTSTSYQEIKIVPNSEIKFGNRISLSNGDFIIGNGVNHVKISVNLNIHSSVQDVFGITVYKNNTKIIDLFGYKYSSSYAFYTLSNYIFEVSENDVINAKLYVDRNGTNVTIKKDTFITLEEI